LTGGEGDLSEDQTHTIVVNQTNGDVNITTDFDYNSGTTFVVGNTVSNPLFSSTGWGTVAKFDGPTGVSLWEYERVTLATNDPVVFYVSDDNEIFMASYNTGRFVGAYVNVGGDVTTSFDFTGVSGFYRALAFDPVTERFHIMCSGHPGVNQVTRFIYSKAGVLVGTEWFGAPVIGPSSFCPWAVAYNDDFYYAGGIVGAWAIYRNDDTVLYALDEQPVNVEMRLTRSGSHIYLLHSPSITDTYLLKITITGTLVWKYVFNSNFYMQAGAGGTWLSVNSAGDCLVYLWGTSPSEASFLISAAGSLVWQKNVEWLNGIEPDRSYYGGVF
jgi:hypothetical protein